MVKDSQGRRIPQAKFYVSCMDPFMSDWGEAKDKENILILPCDSEQERDIVLDNIQGRGDQKKVRVHTSPPTFHKGTYFVQLKTRDDYPNWFKKGYFKTKNVLKDEKDVLYRQRIK